jgi:hypothetical protein
MSDKDVQSVLYKMLDHLNKYPELGSELGLIRIGIGIYTPRALTKLVRESIGPHSSQILACNDVFFTKDLHEAGVYTGYTVIHAKLVGLWSTLGTVDRAYIWFWLHKLLACCAK